MIQLVLVPQPVTSGHTDNLQSLTAKIMKAI